MNATFPVYVYVSVDNSAALVENIESAMNTTGHAHCAAYRAVWLVNYWALLQRGYL